MGTEMKLYRVDVDMSLYVVADNEASAVREATRLLQRGEPTCEIEQANVWATELPSKYGVLPADLNSYPWGESGDRTIGEMLDAAKVSP